METCGLILKDQLENIQLSGGLLMSHALFPAVPGREVMCRFFEDNTAGILIYDNNEH
jgi:hypothetical protein